VTDQPPDTEQSLEESPTGTWSKFPKHPSHLWTKSQSFTNLVWRPDIQPNQAPEGKPAPATAAPPEDDALVRVKVPIKLKGKRVGAIEICCGHAGLTAALCDSGLEAIGIDWKRNRHSPQVPIITADLTTEEGQEFVRKLVQQDHVMYIHLAPPCGTYTRAREIPIAQWKLDLWPGMPNPQPLRTDEFPAGLPAESMSKTDAIKVEKGNIIANFCAEIAQYWIDSNKLFSIENPTKSII
jgi:hypothetical protein